MATIKDRNNELRLYPLGLVKMSGGLYDTIVRLVEVKYPNSLKAITKPLFVSFVRDLLKSTPDSKLVYSTPGRVIRLTMFVHNIQFDGERSLADIELSLPLLAKQEEHGQIWNMILQKVEFVGARVESGGLRFPIILKGNHKPVEIKYPGMNGQKSFVLTSEIPTLS